MLDQKAREVRASSARGVDMRRDRIGTMLAKSLAPAVGRAARSNRTAADALVARTGAAGTAGRAAVDRGRALCRASEVTLRAHDPQRTLERGFARVEDETGEPILTTAQARVAGRFGVVFADGRVEAEVAAARRRRRRTRPRDPAEFGQTRLKGLDPDE